MTTTAYNTRVRRREKKEKKLILDNDDDIGNPNVSSMEFSPGGIRKDPT